MASNLTLLRGQGVKDGPLKVYHPPVPGWSHHAPIKRQIIQLKLILRGSKNNSIICNAWSFLPKPQGRTKSHQKVNAS